MQFSGSDRKNIFLKQPRLVCGGTYRPAAGAMRSAHTHEFTELAFLKKGSGSYSVNGKLYPLRRGDLVICNPHVPHFEVINDDPEREILFLGVSRIHIDGMESGVLFRGDDFCIVPSGEYEDALGFLFDNIAKENERRGEWFRSVSSAYLTAVLAIATRLTRSDPEPPERDKTVYYEVRRYVDEHFTEINSIEEVCRTLFVNKYYVTHLFKKMLEVPPMQYVIRKRVGLARNLLAFTDAPVAEIARECGFPDPSYFCRVFKKVEGVSPLGFRKNPGSETEK